MRLLGKWLGLVLLGSLFASGCEETGIVADRNWLNPQILEFGPRVVGGLYSLDATITNRSNAEAVVGSVRFDPDVAAFNARTETNDTLTGQPLRPGRPLDFRVNFQPGAIQGFDTTMLINVGGTEVPLDITGTGVEGNTEIIVTPDSLEFGPVLIGSRVTRTIQVENAGDRSVSLSQILIAGSPMPDQMGDSMFYVTRPGSQTAVRDVFFSVGETQTFEVHYRPPAEARNELELELQFTNQRNAVVTTAGTGVVPGALDCAPVFHDFGQKIRGQIDQVSVLCTATGGVVRLSAVGFDVGSSRFFGADAPPEVGRLLAAGESVLFQVNFVAQGLPKVHEARFVLTPEGGGTPSTLFFRAEVVAPPVADTQVSVRLNWDTPGTDLDLHFIKGDRSPFDTLSDCFFRQKNPDWGFVNDPIDDPFLDRDDINGYGPEEMNLALARDTQYNVYVHFYKAPLGGRPSIASVSINLFGNQVAVPVRLLQDCGESWHVGRIDIDGVARTGRFTVVDGLSDLTARAECP